MPTDSAEGTRLRLLVDVLRSFADATTDYPRLLETIVRRVADVTGLATSIRLLSSSGGTLETAAGYDPRDDETFKRLGAVPIPITAKLREALDASRAYIEPIASPEGVTEAHPSEGASIRLESVLVAPLVARGKALGFLFVVRRHGDPGAGLTDDDVEVVDALACHAALALSNARLLRELDSIERARSHERSVLDTVSAPLVLLNRTGRIIAANRAFLHAFGVDEAAALGAPILEVGGAALAVPELVALFSSLPPEDTAEDDGIELSLSTAQGPRTYVVRTKKTVRPGNSSETTLVTLVDITDRIAASAISRRHTLLFSSTSEAIVGLDTDFVVQEWNPAAERLFGWPAADARGKPIATVLSIIEGADREKHREVLLAGGTVRAQLRAKNRAGEWVDVHLSTQPLVDRGTTTGYVSVMTDLTELTRLERELERRVEELTVANEELESFSYSVSHDLRAPVRAIDGFSEILEEEHGKSLDAEGRRMLGLVRKNAKRMGLLIDDILALSRTGRQPLVAEDIDMDALAKSALEDALRTEPDRVIRTTIASLPPAWGDASLLRQVWVNLYTNAVKYTRGREDATIDTSAAETPTEIVYTVSDNGAGFDMRYADKLFGTFERLHSAKEFEGTGIGLAIVARIMKRHGGRAWGEGEVGRGATFHVALPRRNDDGERKGA
ncbi:MAG: PAS domain S-box protein [Labilithrix sp.]|nr:PAS domain S-box protein [Labilithrix sp.]MCW5816146.1 PAS domain S-box protein [Labilithrix sp.]